MSAQEQFHVDVRSDERATVLAVAGELDLATSPVLEQEIDRVRDGDAELLIVDLRDLRFMDSTGLHALVKAHRRAQDAGRRFAVVHGGGQIERLLSLTGVGELLVVARSPEELLHAG
jgi:anti-sigma B factor antagonist